MPSKRIAIIGAGPIGLEAALYGASLGHDVQLHERGEVGEHMRDWGHVTLFSPTSRNISSLARRELERAGVRVPGEKHYLTGREHVERCLSPLAGSRLLAGRVHTRSTVRHIGRDGIGKSDLLGGGRERHPFRLLLDGPGGETLLHADVVLDCSGTYGRANALGSGNIPAPGERAAERWIDYRLPDIAGSARADYASRRVLLVGAGMSAATALDALRNLPGTHVTWITHGERTPPYERIAGDPLPERDRLACLANDLASGNDARVAFHAGTVVERLCAGGSEVTATLRSRGRERSVTIDRILAHVGYSPDNSIYRELQIHECYATLGPMGLAAGLLADGSTDCLAQTSRGPDSLQNPEPGFFLVGAKSYGKNSSFLIQLGLAQVREVYCLIEGRHEATSVEGEPSRVQTPR